MVDPAANQTRSRRCDLGYLRHAYRKTDGSLGYRCPAEPVADFVRKDGNPDETTGRLCVCNGLMTTAGLPQIRPDQTEDLALVTAGNEVATVASFIPPGQDFYSAADVVHQLLQTTAVGTTEAVR